MDCLYGSVWQKVCSDMVFSNVKEIPDVVDFYFDQISHIELMFDDSHRRLSRTTANVENSIISKLKCYVL